MIEISMELFIRMPLNSITIDGKTTYSEKPGDILAEFNLGRFEGLIE